jgi:hypothetical protein
MAQINYSAFKKFRQEELKTFADTVYNNMTGKELYDPFKALVKELRPIAETFQLALIEALKGGTDRTKAKNDAKDALMLQLTKIGKLMDALWIDSKFDNSKEVAGFELAKPPIRSTPTPVTYVEAPSNLVFVNDNRKGVVNLTWNKVDNALVYAFEMQQADGSWKNGMYADKTSMQLSDLAVGEKATIRVKTIGPNSLVSDYSEPVSVWVA